MINHLGDGPEWLYRALDPHTRNYILLGLVAALGAWITTRRARFAVGAVLAMLLAGYLACVALEAVKLFIDRPRPRRS